MIAEILMGLIIGVVMALTGAGGGILGVPMLVFGAGLDVSVAAPVALLAVGLAAAFGALLGLKARIVRYRAALWMAATGMLAAPVGVWLAQRMDERLLGLLFVAVLAVSAWRTYRQAAAEHIELASANARTVPCTVDDSSRRFIWTAHCARMLAATGAMAGLLSGLLGVGGGFILVPVLKRVSDLPMRSVVATTLAVIALVSTSGVGSSVLAGTLDARIALPFAAGTLAGMYGGGLLAARVAGPLLQKGFALVAALVAAGMLARVLL